MSKEAVERLSEAIKDRDPIDRHVGRVHHCAYAEVSPHDVLAVGSMVKEHTDRIKAILSGSKDPGEHSIHLKVTDILHLLEHAVVPAPTSETPPVEVPPAPQ